MNNKLREDRYTIQNDNLKIDELEVWSFHNDWLINCNLIYHPNCTYQLKDALESINFIKQRRIVRVINYG